MGDLGTTQKKALRRMNITAFLNPNEIMIVACKGDSDRMPGQLAHVLNESLLKTQAVVFCLGHGSLLVILGTRTTIAIGHVCQKE